MAGEGESRVGGDATAIPFDGLVAGLVGVVPAVSCLLTIIKRALVGLTISLEFLIYLRQTRPCHKKQHNVKSQPFAISTHLCTIGVRFDVPINRLTRENNDRFSANYDR